MNPVVAPSLYSHGRRAMIMSTTVESTKEDNDSAVKAAATTTDAQLLLYPNDPPDVLADEQSSAIAPTTTMDPLKKNALRSTNIPTLATNMNAIKPSLVVDSDATNPGGDTSTSSMSYTSELGYGGGISLSKNNNNEEEKQQQDTMKVERTINKEECDQVPTPPSRNRNMVATVTPSLSMEEEEDETSNNGNGNTTMFPTPRRSILRHTDEHSSSSPAAANNATTSSSRRGSKRRRVSFSNVQIRRYPMILGDNPATPSGPPLSLGWEYEVLPAMNITDFESFRLRSRRFHSSHLILSQYKRVEIISRMGYPQKEIKKAEDEVKKVQRHRKLTMAFSPCGKLEQAFQSIGRKWKKNVVGKAKDRSKT